MFFRLNSRDHWRKIIFDPDQKWNGRPESSRDYISLLEQKLDPVYINKTRIRLLILLAKEQFKCWERTLFGRNYGLIHVILNPIVEIYDVAVDTWKTFLVTFNTPWYNTHQSCGAINVADKRTTRITLTRVFPRRGNWFTTLIERRLICMRNSSADLILINPKTVIREQTLKTFSFEHKVPVRNGRSSVKAKGQDAFFW